MWCGFVGGTSFIYFGLKNACVQKMCVENLFISWVWESQCIHWCLGIVDWDWFIKKKKKSKPKMKREKESVGI